MGIVACCASILSFSLAIFFTRGYQPLTEVLSFGGFVNSYSTLGLSALALISLFVANAFYQFVDVTQWQRLLSMAVNNDDLEATARALRNNVLVGGACSALTWVIAVAFGIFLKCLFPSSTTDAYSILSTFMSELTKHSDMLAGFIAFCFVASLIAIMFSTLDSLVSATSFTVQNDLLGNASGTGRSLIVVRASTIGVAVAQLVFYLVISEYAGDKVDAVLYVCWSFQLALLPVTVMLLAGRSGAFWSRALSISAGCVAAFAPLVFYASEEVFKLSPWWAVLAATVTYIVFGGARKTKLANGS